MHRDLKPENILISDPKTLEIKITDFGCSTWIKHTTKKNDLIGSTYYMAPEIVTHQDYDSKVDIWSAGVILFQLLSGHLPFEGNT